MPEAFNAEEHALPSPRLPETKKALKDSGKMGPRRAIPHGRVPQLLALYLPGRLLIPLRAHLSQFGVWN